MRTYPWELLGDIDLQVPPASGPGSGKDAWMALAWLAVNANRQLRLAIEMQRQTIRELEGEVALLREQIATRKPKGGRDRIADETVSRIEWALDAGQSTRKIARQFGVSAMTVTRIKKRMVARQAPTA
jgi:DNA invertase Pin-like site-specific DNA recombinase